MAKKPNYDFERREREKAKAEKLAAKAKAKGERSSETIGGEPAAEKLDAKRMAGAPPPGTPLMTITNRGALDS